MLLLLEISGDCICTAGGAILWFRSLTDVMLKYFSKDRVELGKELGSAMGELPRTIAFEVLIIAIAMGTGAV